MTVFTVPGFAVGHWTHPTGRTGCTVILAERPAVAVRDVRGGAPGTRETDLLTAGSLVRRVDAVLLTGGSAFGLAAAEGVVRWLRERGQGFPTPVFPVPIVTAAVVYDLSGPDLVYPDADAGYAACSAARPDGWQNGRFGAGAGTTVGKVFGREGATPTGIGTHFLAVEGGHLAALAVVNALGDIIDPATGRIVAGVRTQDSGWRDSREAILRIPLPDFEAATNTTLVVVVTDLALDYHALTRMAIAAHDALARVIRPAHTIFDGDTVFVLARDEAPTPPTRILKVATATEVAVEQALLASVPPL
ncbi:P1 family peptidase [Thermomicrobium sp. 4228-Ro]|uniref:P1 family peptidase n=1 Tax=Thermomicrobium sp. 4228-Ro TaxID=2993937 RepID=UPI00224890DE|nr:P1 family peptidase [Thermomicrobium sp. 4228-Ro]MCX2725929.1 P1 family peptidase [Thermomicrobium sp. 4228-Ro]